MADPTQRRFGLLAQLAFAVFGGFALLLVSLVVLAVGASVAHLETEAVNFATLQLAHARAGLLAVSSEGRPPEGVVSAVRGQLAAIEPRIQLRVFDHGAPLGDHQPVDALDREGLSLVRAGRPGPHGLRDPAYPGAGGHRYYAPLASDPEVVVSVRFPVELRAGSSWKDAAFPAATLGSVMLFIGGGLYVMLRRTTRRITRLSHAVTTMAASNDFTQEIPRDKGKDEIGALAQCVGALAGLLRTTAGTLQETSSKLAGAGEALNETAGAQTELLEQHSRAIEDAAATAEEIRQMSETAAQRAEAVLEAAARAGELSATSESAVRHSLEALGEIRNQVAEMGERIAAVSERANQISGITQSVKDIADSSNMLALNAAIEAVRSGEQGKGFALVAREMRSLADQSIKATERVREILEDVTISIQQATAISSRGTQRIESGLGQLIQSGESVRALARMVSENSQSAQVIATAVRQQNVGVVQLVRAIADQRALAERTSERLTLTQAHAEALQSLTRQVGELLKSYRL